MDPELEATVCTVYDPIGCYLLLTGRMRYAPYFGYDALYQPNNYGFYDPDEPQHRWYVTGICCRPVECFE